MVNKKEIKGINKVVIENNSVIMWQKNKIFSNENVIYEGDINYFYVYKNSYFIKADSFKTLVWINDGKTKNFENHIGVELVLDKENILSGNWNEDYTIPYKYRFNLSKNSEVWKHESYFGNSILIEDKLFGNSNETIYQIDKELGTPIWSSDINHFGTFINHWSEEKPVELSKFVGIWQNQLVILLNNGMFIGLKVDSGKLLWQKQNADENYTDQEVNYSFSNFYNPFLDEQKGMIYILQGRHFIEFDLNTQKGAYIWDSKDVNPENYLFIIQSRKVGELIYFTANFRPNSGNCDTVGAFDITKNKVVWQYTFAFEKGVFIPNIQSAIQANNQNFFVLDNTATLHVFEKEENNSYS